MLFPVKLTKSQKVFLSGVSIDKGEVKNLEDTSSPEGKNIFSIKTKRSSIKRSTTIEIQLKEEACCNQINLNVLVQRVYDINVFFSHDFMFWFRVPVKSLENEKKSTILRLPLIRCRYLQIVISSIEMPDILSGSISKNIDFKFESSSNKDRLWIPENLIDGRDDYGWACTSQRQPKDDFVIADLGDAYHIQEISLRSTKGKPALFPKNFIVESSNDKKNWRTMIREGNFLVAPLSWYRWSDLSCNARYIKIKIMATKDHKQYEILGLNVFALPENDVKVTNRFMSHQTKNIYEGNEATSGLIRFSEHNGVHPLRALQSNDPRLREATNVYPGIVRMAKDQESTPNATLCSDDSRITPATEEKRGIIRLAKDQEIIEDAALQASDSRLRISTTEYPGIVQLAKNKEKVARYAVQSNDDRLRNASTTWPGIIQLAKHGESHKDKVVSSDDPRLLEGSEEIKGRVRFAKDKSVESMTAVQGNDSRLLSATEKRIGLVRLAKLGQKGALLAIQANDPRLDAPRKPLSHKHDYAPQKHPLNSHEGSLNISLAQENTNRKFSYNLTDLNSFPFSVKNIKGPSAAFQGGVIIEGREEAGIQVFSKSHIGSKIKSKDQPGGVFFSEKNFALHLPTELDELLGSSKSILAEGDSVFRRNISFEYGLSIAISWSSFSDELFVGGDLLTIQEGFICKLKSNHQPFIGVFTKASSFCLSEGSHQKKNIKIAIFGVIPIRIKGRINSGDWVGYLDDEPGVARRISQVQKQHSFAIAMEPSSKETEKLIPCLIRR